MEYLWILVFLMSVGLILKLLVKYTDVDVKKSIWFLYICLSGVGLTYIVGNEFINRYYVGMAYFEKSFGWLGLMGILSLGILVFIAGMFFIGFIDKYVNKYIDKLEGETSSVTKKKTTI